MNIFTYEPNKLTLALTTEGLHLNGTLMKNIDFRRPEIIKKLLEKKSLVKIGDYVIIDNYLFFVARKHYNSKFNLSGLEVSIKKMFDEISMPIKTTAEDYIDLVNFMKSINDNLEIYETSEWKM